MIYAFRHRILIALSAMLGLLNAATAPKAYAFLSRINLSNTPYKATVSMSFNSPPSCTFFTLHKPERMVLDVNQKGKIGTLPLHFSGKNLIKNIRSSALKDNKHMRLVFDLSHYAKIRMAKNKHGRVHFLVFVLVSENSVSETLIRKIITTPVTINKPHLMQLAPNSANHTINKTRMTAYITRGVVSRSNHTSASSSDRIIVAIDAGHGGQDPGAVGQNGLEEKNVTIAVARRLQLLLSNDPKFKPVLTRNGDYFISVMGRSDVARKKGANVLVSIHADAVLNRSANGVSVWVLSNRRAKSEMADWLVQYEKQSELLGGAGDVLANSRSDPYLSQAVLDLQFGYSQRVSYDVALKALKQLQHVSFLHKRRPEHASLGVLRSPDIPSLLVETGFISNTKEERLLSTSSYQDKIAGAIYNGLRDYFLAHSSRSNLKIESK